MKKGFKYINAVLFMIAFGVSFMNFLSISIVHISLIDFVRISLGEKRMPKLNSIGVSLDVTDFKLLGIIIVVFLCYVLLGAFLSTLVKTKVVYVVDILLAITQCMCIILFYMVIFQAISNVSFINGLSNQREFIKINLWLLAIWIFIYIAILSFSIIGLFIKEKQVEKKKFPIIAQEMQGRKNPYLGQETQENKDNSMKSPKHMKRINSEKKLHAFYGAIIGVKGEYERLVYMLEEDEKVFFRVSKGKIHVLEKREYDTIAVVYFKNNEYCIETVEQNTVFLISGQPLGKNRRYYIPRGTEIYFSENRNIFRLA